MIEGSLFRPALRVDQDELLGLAGEVVPIPETCVVVEPVRCDASLENEAVSLALCRTTLGRLGREA